MKPADLISRRTEWLSGAGPQGDIVISSRIRLARNVAGFPFLSRCDGEQRAQLLDLLAQALETAKLERPMSFFNVAAASAVVREMLVERQLISRQMAEGAGPRGVGVSDDETLSVMVNEEDHLRIQTLRAGFQVDECFRHVNAVDDALEQRVSYAFSGQWGYLTACPTNVGTGIRVSVMLHLPALKMTGEIERVFQAARDMRLAVRGLYGEGTEASGDFFQVSNQTTLGRTEAEIIADFSGQIIPEIINFERAARTGLLAESRAKIEDRVHRARGLLASARLMESAEALHLLSMLRLGATAGVLTDIAPETINELFLAVQPGHIQQLSGHELDDAQRDRFRADYIRGKLA